MSKMEVALMIKISGKTAKKRLNMWEDPNEFCFHFSRMEHGVTYVTVFSRQAAL